MAQAFIQYKGTDLCADIWCECGKHLHYDGYGAYTVKCKHCGSLYELQQIIEAKKVETSQWTPIELGEDDEEW